MQCVVTVRICLSVHVHAWDKMMLFGRLAIESLDDLIMSTHSIKKTYICRTMQWMGMLL